MPIAQTLPFATGHARASDGHAATPVAGVPSFEVIETRDGLAGLAADWNGLFARAGRPTQVFQTHAFAETWARTYLDKPGVRLAVVAARENGRLVMVWPLVVERSLGARVLSWLGAPIAQYGDVLVEAGPRALAMLEAGWDFIRSHFRPDVVRLRKVRADAAIGPLLTRISTSKCCHDEAASVALGACAELGIRTGSFEERQSAKARKNRRRLLRRLEEQGAVRFEALEPSAAAADIAARGLAMKRRWLEARGLYSAAFADRRIERLFAVAAAPGAEALGCRVFALSLAGTPIAVAMGFECEGRLTLHMIAYDIEREKCGAGVLNLEAILRWAEARGIVAVDLLAPKAAYKMDWADGTSPVCDHSVAVSLNGWASLRLLDGAVRPAAKAVLARLPVALTRHFAARAA